MSKRGFKVGLLLALCLGLSGPVSAQVATPSIDPSAPSWLASAGSWRFGTSLSVSGKNGSQATDLQKLKGRGFDPSGLIVFQPNQVTAELYSLGNSQKYFWEASSDSLYLQKKKESRFNLAVRGNGRVSVGLGAVNRVIDSRQVLRVQKGFGGSLGFRMGDVFYGGVGMDRMTERVAGVADKQWSDYIAGLALVYGDPDGSMFRLEVAGRASPKVNQGTRFAQVHHQTLTQYGTLEVLWDRWFLSGRNTQTKRFALLNTEKNQQKVERRVGLGYRSLSFSLIFYRILVDTVAPNGWYKERTYQATLAVGFL